MSVNFNGLKRLLSSEKGVFLPAAAVIVPGVLMMMALGLDSANLLAQKARLTSAIDEAALAISAWGVQELSDADRKSAEALITSYINYYLPAIKEKPRITLTSVVKNEGASALKYVNYEFSASVKVPLVFDLGLLSGFGHDVEMGTGKKNIKKFSGVEADYVFIVDFSGSQAGKPLQLLKDVVKDISQFALNNNKNNKIAIVPFSIGVPVILPGTNERGGQRVGCSVVFVPNKNYDLNYAFWGDKHPFNISGLKARMYHLDNARWLYYRDRVKEALPKMSTSAYIAKWCKRNTSYGEGPGRANYSCKTAGYPYTDLWSADSQKIIIDEYDKAIAVKWAHNEEKTIVNKYSINYEATLEQMFDKSAIKTFPLQWSLIDKKEDRPYYHMCQNGGWNNHMTNNGMVNSKARSWLIELTNNITLINQFQNMWQEGWTQLGAALLRSVPVMMDGTNKRKVFIILSDGEDTAGADVTNELLMTYNVCKKIEEGILARPATNAVKVEFYYISTVKANDGMKLWSDNCTGPDRAKTSTTKDELVQTIKNIMSDETGHFAL